MQFAWFIAKRYFRARKRSQFLSFITTFTIVGIALGTSALIITLSILGGFEREIKEKVVGFTSHITVEGFQGKALADYQRSSERIKREIPNIKAVAPFVAREGMIRSHAGVDGIFLKGVMPSTDISLARSLIVEGRYLRDSSPTPEIVIGRKLANRLAVRPGDKLVIFGLPRSSGEASLQPRAMQGTLVGIYESGMSEYDEVYGYTTIQDAQRLFQTGDVATGLDILVNDLEQVDQTALDVQNLLGYPHYARTVFQNYHNLFSWVELQKKLSPIVLSLIVIVATVNVIGTILMFVLDKSAAIGVLKTLGVSRRGIRRIFVLQGMTIAASGIILGNLLALVLCWLEMRFHLIALPSDIYYMSSVPIELHAVNFFMVSAQAAILCLLTTLLPAYAASRLDPVELLRFS